MKTGRNDAFGTAAAGRPIRLARPLVALAAALALGGAQAQEVPCEVPGELVPISGRIANNALGPGETLGSGTAVVRGYGKMHCGLQGRAFLNPDGTFGGFDHTIICDDRFHRRGDDESHSQITAITRFDGIPDFQSCGIPGLDLEFGSFREISHPQAGRGIFSPTGGGTIIIDGTVNCAGAIDMEYQGEVCVLR